MSMTTEVAAATAGTITEAPRDLPNVPADRQALGLVRPYLGMVAWPTVFVAIAIVAAFATRDNAWRHAHHPAVAWPDPQHLHPLSRPDAAARGLPRQHGFFCVSLGIAIISASAPDFFTEDTPTAVLVRQVLGAIAQFEKASSVAKLAAARKRKREREGRCEGRKPLRETHPEAVALARKLRRRRPKGGQLSLREVSKELATRGFLNERGKPYAAKSVASMLR